MTTNKLDASVPANNWKIIELYNKIKKDELDPSPTFQRKLVWKKQHKNRFIQTILLNFPFPEIYIAPGELNTDTLTLQDLIVDGQQRCTTIVNYIDGKDVFVNSSRELKKFRELSKEEKEDFLNFEVSVRYMKNASKEQIAEIFQRINSTEYSLNTIERDNAKWGDSEFILFAKQIIEKDDNLNFEIISYKLNKDNKELLHNFFVTEFKIFSENDLKRMLALQYVLTLLSTLISDKYFRRNEYNQKYIELYNDEFIDASFYEIGLTETIKFLMALNLSEKSYWLTKTNVFTLIIELFKFDDLNKISKDKFKNSLESFELDYKDYQHKPSDFKENFTNQTKYFEFSREAMNELPARELRGKLMNTLINNCLV